MIKLLSEKPLLGLIPSSMPPAVAEVAGHLATWQVHLAWGVGLLGGGLAVAVHVRNLIWGNPAALRQEGSNAAKETEARKRPEIKQAAPGHRRSQK